RDALFSLICGDHAVLLSFPTRRSSDLTPATERVRELFSNANIAIPTQQDWVELKASVQEHGIYNQNLQAVPPTGSISYINNSTRSEEHTSELQSREKLVCRLLLEKKNP